MEGDLQKFLDELRSRLSVADVVAEKVKLVRKGREYLGLCPFHNEKTPSFTVNEAKGFYHGFGCGAHGDIIRFEMEANGLPFMDAVEKLAHKAGLAMPKFSKEHSLESQKKQSLFEIMELAVSFYEKALRLPVGAKGLEYFYHRGLSDELIKKFRLGYAPSNNDLKAYLKTKGVNEFDMAELGLIAQPQDQSKTTHDFFRNRVMIPIFDKQNRPIAFGGRIMGDGQPKYLNSPETTLFNKRKMLYNFNFARDKGYENKRLIICEGYMDVIALDKFGFSYAAAPMGTALTEDQITEAWKVVNEPVLCFDGDGAGIKAALRSVDRALPILKPGFSLQFMFLPDKLDPDEFLRAKGAQEFEKLFSNTMPLIDLLWEKYTKDQPSDTPERKALIEKNLKEEVLKITDKDVRLFYAQEMKKRIFETYGGGTFKPATTNKKPSFYRTKQPLGDVDLRFILASLLIYPKLAEELEEKLMMFDLSKFKLINLLHQILALSHETDDSKVMIDNLISAGFETDLQGLWEMSMIKSQKTDIFHLKKQILSLLTGIQIKQLKYDLNEAKLKLSKDGSTETDYEQYLQLQNELNTLMSETNEI
ncbi:MAG: DNA primase [Alphaproteobacteria bacterium]|nr:DNA primase [Alphaproteobacteria bacterium]